MTIATLDRENTLFATGFEDQDETLLWLTEQISSGAFTEDDILFKDIIDFFTSTQLRRLYKDWFGRKRIFFKDYVTNEEIIPVTFRSIFHPTQIVTLNRFQQTFFSLMSFLDNPSYLVVYRN